MNIERRPALAAVVLAPILWLAAPATAQRAPEPVTTAIHLDARKGAKLAGKSGGRISVSDSLRNAGSVELTSVREVPVVVHVFRTRGGKVLESFRSRIRADS